MTDYEKTIEQTVERMDSAESSSAFHLPLSAFIRSGIGFLQGTDSCSVPDSFGIRTDHNPESHDGRKNQYFLTGQVFHNYAIVQ